MVVQLQSCLHPLSPPGKQGPYGGLTQFTGGRAEVKDQGRLSNQVASQGEQSRPPAIGEGSTAPTAWGRQQWPERLTLPATQLQGPVTSVHLGVVKCKTSNDNDKLCSSLPNLSLLPVVSPADLQPLQARNTSAGHLSCYSRLGPVRLGGGCVQATVKMSQDINPVDHISNTLHFDASSSWAPTK